MQSIIFHLPFNKIIGKNMFFRNVVRTIDPGDQIKALGPSGTSLGILTVRAVHHLKLRDALNRYVWDNMLVNASLFSDWAILNPKYYLRRVIISEYDFITQTYMDKPITVLEFERT